MNRLRLKDGRWTNDLLTLFLFYHPESKQAFDILVTDQSKITPYFSGEEDENGLIRFPQRRLKKRLKNILLNKSLLK